MEAENENIENRYKDELGKAEVWKYVKRLFKPRKNARGTLCHHVCILCTGEGKAFEDSILPVFFKTNSSGRLLEYVSK